MERNSKIMQLQKFNQSWRWNDKKLSKTSVNWCQMTKLFALIGTFGDSCFMCCYAFSNNGERCFSNMSLVIKTHTTEDRSAHEKQVQTVSGQHFAKFCSLFQLGIIFITCLKGNFGGWLAKKRREVQVPRHLEERSNKGPFVRIGKHDSPAKLCCDLTKKIAFFWHSQHYSILWTPVSLQQIWEWWR